MTSATIRVGMFSAEVTPGEHEASFRVSQHTSADPFCVIVGTIDWQGCVRFGSNGTAWVHLCTPDQARDLAGLLAMLWTLGDETIVHWNGEP